MANVTIGGLTNKPTPDLTDELEIQETGAGDSKKVTLAAIKTVVGGGGAGRQTYFVSANAVTPTVTNGAGYISSAETTSGRPDLRSVKFSSTADEHVQFGIMFPDQWDKGTLTYDYTWEGLAATTGVAFALAAVAIADNETFDVDFGTPIVVTDAAQGAVEENNTSAESAALTVAGSPANGKMIIFDFYRDVSDGSDDMPGDAGLVSLNIYWTQTATTDD